MGEQRKRPARQSDIARLAGVSQATVSSVITGSGDRYGIAQETRDKVMAAVEALGYVPSVAARQMRGTRNRLLGVHTFEPIFPISQMNFYHEFLVGIEEQAVVDGYNLLLFTATDTTSGKRPLFIDGNSQLTVADGTILLGLDREKSELERLAASGYPFVHIGRRIIDGVEIPFVSPDYQSGVAAAIDRLTELGHTKIAYLLDDISFEATAARRDGYRIAMEAHGLEAAMVEPSELLPATAELDGTTAFLVEGGPQLLWLESYARAHGLSIPQELSVVVLSDDAGAAVPERQWSTLSAPRRQLGSEAVRLLVSILDGVDSPSHRYLDCLPLNESSISSPRTAASS
ncbi:LacI family DNA-binding transcriptional regulator [Arthrobacter sp. CJ23]|uniref:LacI family DNA-binding transcriptional regulator n=1 Tax=Arthrobacter sp. CJ23 TaxID=2972479 RepID=UPI00215BAABE|nr:LacI family DNA-binding transcriptional regulator [Arthrobacter sp. CJ23]UVJ38992.1 LacI family transcriptional regulator [Arthrobacter sp. CJ23]